MQSEESGRLAAEAVRGSQEAFVQLIKAYEGTLYQVSYAMLRSDSDCVDAAQETILEAFRSIGQLKEPKYFKTWLIRILIHQCNRILRRRSKIVSMDFVAEPSFSMNEEDRLDLQAAVQRLEDELQIVITLFYMEDLSYSEIAEMLEIPEGTVKSRLHRAKLKLAAWMDPSSKGRYAHE
ncbi:sigma-70 family RNA polymerase sigma factor [Paenibacillus turpanensis]|uniref:sigma-70 family RNA polymerase sigma factor n=1 Tax=Paenibacillus turpanensis TaxID=2689078 RepID=UPI00140E5FA0|nr:sigma-70 family RNA polymerase sigma factor [Paenibacillus turpanensis]